MKTLLMTPMAAKGWPNYCPPIGLCYLKACLLQAGLEDVKVIDMAQMSLTDAEQIVREEKPQVVGITCFTETRVNTLKTAGIVKAVTPGIKVILGGVHATLMYPQIMQHYPAVDVICLGESEVILVELLKAFERDDDLQDVKGIVYRQDGRIVKTAERETIKDLDSLPFPDYDDLDLRIYKEAYPFGKGKPRASVVTSRGCPFNCTFCVARQVWKVWRPRSPEKVVNEIEWLVSAYGFEIFSIADDLFTLNTQRTQEICEEILKRKLRIKWSAQTRTDCVSKETLTLMKEAGCRVLQFGVESGSPTILKNLNKREKIEDAVSAFTWCQKVGIKTQCNIMVGAPGETRSTIEETKALIRQIRPDYLNVNILRIFPGTEIFRRAKEEGLIDEDLFLTDEEYMYYTAAMGFSQLNSVLRELCFLHAGLSGLSGHIQLASRAFSELRQNPRKILLSLLPWK